MRKFQVLIFSKLSIFPALMAFSSTSIVDKRKEVTKFGALHTNDNAPTRVLNHSNEKSLSFLDAIAHWFPKIQWWKDVARKRCYSPPHMCLCLQTALVDFYQPLHPLFTKFWSRLYAAPEQLENHGRRGLSQSHLHHLVGCNELFHIYFLYVEDG